MADRTSDESRVADVTLDRLVEVAARTQEVTLVPGTKGHTAGGIQISDLDHDSHRVGPGTAFIAVRGATSDGHDFIGGAIDQGCPAVVVERRVDVAIPQVVVADTRSLMAPLAAEIHHHPAESMTSIGVTGTNGKTTVTHMLESIATAAGRRPGLVGTVGAHIGGESIPLRHTTPEATELQRLLHRMVDDGVDLVALEVSSHAISQRRTDDIRFDVAGFTNLTQDHLDYHGDMESYFEAKAGLFVADSASHAVICVDDVWGKTLALRVDIPVTTVSVGGIDADVTAKITHLGPSGTRFEVRLPDEDRADLSIPLGGRFNVANALVAVAAAHRVGIASDAMVSGLSRMGPVPGRFELVDVGQSFAVIVDYAHTPDAISTVITAVRALTDGRVISVGGAGGDRDRSKRPAMGRAFAEADLAVLTSDNPRSESPMAILHAVTSGVPAGADHEVEPDRRRAIRRAVAAAQPGDVVLVLGKGHEPGQQIGAETVPFDDRVVAAEEISAVRGLA